MPDIDHLAILRSLKELPFPVGKGTLAEILVGATTKRMLANDIYMELKSYGTLSQHQQARIEQMIDRLLTNGLITQTGLQGQPHIKVLKLTAKGTQELRSPTLKERVFSAKFSADTIDSRSRLLAEQFSFFLKDFNKEQQHAIVCPSSRILCVAGAGTGKTTVLTKRIEFLVKYRGVNPKEILAITFTRKAKAEMQHRLSSTNVHVTTFNGFCEQLLRAHGLAKPLLTYSQKIRLFHEAVAAEGWQLPELVREYFTDGQRKGATRDELERRLMGDIFSIIDHYSNEDEPITHNGQSSLATTLLSIARTIDASMTRNGLRDYGGQLRDALALLRTKPEARPRYAHILVDEYQDINIAQQRLLDLLASEHVFVVGDPRQSIFGWRGSQIRFITQFNADATIQLQTNYRSGPAIITLMNRLIAGMGLAELDASREGGTVQTFKYANEDEELERVAALLEHATERNIFVLARTNRQLEDLSKLLGQRNIPHSIRKEEDEADPKGIVLATVHAIKGLEANTVIVLGATSRYFPCKVSDHPVVDIIADAHLDREEEERRLLYVAVSRAKERLIITYTGTPTYFLDGVWGEKTAQHAAHAPSKISTHQRSRAGEAALERLQQWRSQLARRRNVPAYIICPDRTLHELVELRPTTLAQLERIHGLGESRIRQFGDEILELLHQ